MTPEDRRKEIARSQQFAKHVRRIVENAGMSDSDLTDEILLLVEQDRRNRFGRYRIARELRVVRNGFGPAEMWIDGEFFPYATVDGYRTHPQRTEMPSVTVSIVAERVSVTNDINAPREENIPNEEEATPEKTQGASGVYRSSRGTSRNVVADTAGSNGS